MQHKYDTEILDEISAKVDLLGYISSQMELKRNGGNWFGHCPKHVDKTPSFCVTPEKNFFYCFSCGRSGGIINYLREYENMSFDNAVGKASHLARLDLSGRCMSDTVRFLKSLRTLSAPKRHTAHTLLSETEMEKYVKAPIPEWLGEGISQEALDTFGVRVDEAHNRIVYPVRDVSGQLINVKARTRYANYKELKIPKYINYYPLGTMDFFQSMDITKPYILAKREVIIFESIKSVMKAWCWGVKNCVSAEKHSLTPEQIRLLAKMHVSVVLAYDSDISYAQKDVQKDINRMKRIMNVYVMEDRNGLLGGAETKNAPADCGEKVFRVLYDAKRKVI